MGIYLTLKQEKLEGESRVNASTLIKAANIVINALEVADLFQPDSITLWIDAANESIGKLVKSDKYDSSMWNSYLSDFESMIRKSETKKAISEERAGFSLQISGIMKVKLPEYSKKLSTPVSSFLNISWNTDFEVETGDIHFDSYSYAGTEFTDFFQDITNQSIKDNLTKLKNFWTNVIQNNKDKIVEKMIFGEDANSNIFLIGSSWYYYTNPSSIIFDIYNLYRVSSRIASSERTYIFDELKIIGMNKFIETISNTSKPYRTRFMVELLTETQSIIGAHDAYAKKYGLTIDGSHSLNVTSDSYNPAPVASLINALTAIIAKIYERALMPPEQLKNRIQKTANEVIDEFNLIIPRTLPEFGVKVKRRKRSN